MVSIVRINFGKYRNSTLCEIYQRDRNYLEWLNTQPWFKIRFHSFHEELVQYLQKREDEVQINTETFVIYTDGACSNNGKVYARAGIGVYFGENDPRNVSSFFLGLFLLFFRNNLQLNYTVLQYFSYIDLDNKLYCCNVFYVLIIIGFCIFFCIQNS